MKQLYTKSMEKYMSYICKYQREVSRNQTVLAFTTLEKQNHYIHIFITVQRRAP